MEQIDAHEMTHAGPWSSECGQYTLPKPEVCIPSFLSSLLFGIESDLGYQEALHTFKQCLFSESETWISQMGIHPHT